MKSGEIYRIKGTNLKIRIKDKICDYVTFVNINGPRKNSVGSVPVHILEKRYEKESQ